MTEVAGTRQSGFSLLEMVVAVAILGLALGALYRAAGGATGNVRVDERHAYAVELARSLLADNAVVPSEGSSATGETAGGFRWQFTARPEPLARDSRLREGSLQAIEVVVSWADGARQREVRLHSVVEGRPMAAGVR